MPEPAVDGSPSATVPLVRARTASALAANDTGGHNRGSAGLATAGPALLVDPYLRLEQLHDLVVGTDVERVLISKQQKDSKSIRAGIATYLGNVMQPRTVQVRASADSDVHDRVLVGEDGAVHLLGTSLNAIKTGSASTVLVRLPDVAATAQRQRAEAWWRDAEPVQQPSRLDGREDDRR